LFSINSAGARRIDNNGVYGGIFVARGAQWTTVPANTPALLAGQISPVFARFLGLVNPSLPSTTTISSSFATGNGYESAADLATTPTTFTGNVILNGVSTAVVVNGSGPR